MDRSEPTGEALGIRCWTPKILLAVDAPPGSQQPRAIIAGVDAEGNKLCAPFPSEVDGIEW